MGTRDSDLGLYYAGLASSEAPLPLPLQHRISSYADAAKSPEIIVALLAREDLDTELVEQFVKHRSAVVRVAWLNRHSDNAEVFLPLVAGEKRKTVLATLAAQPDLPDEAFASIVERADGLDLVLTVLETKRLEADEAENLIAKVADSKHLTQMPSQRRIAALLGSYPNLWGAIAAAAVSVDVATTAVRKVADLPDEIVERLLNLFVDAPLADREPSFSGLRRYAEVLSALHSCETLSQEGRLRVSASAATVAAVYGPPDTSQKGYNPANTSKRQVVDIANYAKSELPGTVEALKARTPESAERALSDLAAFAAKDPIHGWTSPTAAEIVQTIFVDDAYGPKARCRALRTAVDKCRLTAKKFFALHDAHQFTVTAKMVQILWSRLNADTRVAAINLSQDPTETLEYLLDDGRFTVAARLHELEAAGVLSDELFARGMAFVTAKQLFDRTWYNKELHRRAVEHITDCVTQELGSSETTWEFFEACFENVDTGIVELAAMAATAT